MKRWPHLTHVQIAKECVELLKTVTCFFSSCPALISDILTAADFTDKWKLHSHQRKLSRWITLPEPTLYWLYLNIVYHSLLCCGAVLSWLIATPCFTLLLWKKYGIFLNFFMIVDALGFSVCVVKVNYHNHTRSWSPISSLTSFLKTVQYSYQVKDNIKNSIFTVKCSQHLLIKNSFLHDICMLVCMKVIPAEGQGSRVSDTFCF